MTPKEGLPRYAFGLAGLLLLTTIVMLFSRNSSRIFPSVESKMPSGMHAFAKLLRNEGYTVEMAMEPDRTFATDEIPIVFSGVPVSGAGAFALASTIDQSLLRHMETGGRVIMINLSETRGQFTSTEPIRTMLAKNPHDPLAKPLKVTGIPEETSYGLDFGTLDAKIDQESGLTLWNVETDGPSRRTALCRAYTSTKGWMLSIADGTIATNAFIGKADNAALLLDAVSRFAPSGSRLVFQEARFGNVQNRSLAESFHPAAGTAWNQILLITLIGAFILSRRFGHPIQARYGTEGSRATLDSVSAMMHRSRRSDVAATIIIPHIDRRLRRLLGLPIDSTLADLVKKLPPSLASLRMQAEDATKTRQKGDLDNLRALMIETRDFEASIRGI